MTNEIEQPPETLYSPKPLTLNPDFLPESMFYPNGGHLRDTRQRRANYSKKHIAAHWGMPEPYFCMHCGRTNRQLEKAHLIDVSAGGVDDLRNIGLLCHRCHVLQPITDKSDPEDAIYLALTYFQLFQDDRNHRLYDRESVRYYYFLSQIAWLEREIYDFLDKVDPKGQVYEYRDDMCLRRKEEQK